MPQLLFYCYFYILGVPAVGDPQITPLPRLCPGDCDQSCAPACHDFCCSGHPALARYLPGAQTPEQPSDQPPPPPPQQSCDRSCAPACCDVASTPVLPPPMPAPPMPPPPPPPYPVVAAPQAAPCPAPCPLQTPPASEPPCLQPPCKKCYIETETMCFPEAYCAGQECPQGECCQVPPCQAGAECADPSDKKKSKVSKTKPKH